MKNIAACLASGVGSDWIGKGYLNLKDKLLSGFLSYREEGTLRFFSPPTPPTYKFYYCNVIVQNFVNIYKTLAGALILACTLCTHLHFPPQKTSCMKPLVQW